MTEKMLQELCEHRPLLGLLLFIYVIPAPKFNPFPKSLSEFVHIFYVILWTWQKTCVRRWPRAFCFKWQLVVCDVKCFRQIPVFLRGGYIIPVRDRLRRSSTVAPYDPYTLLVALDTQVTYTVWYNSNNEHPDGMTLIPWAEGKPLTWDVTAVCPVAMMLYLDAAVNRVCCWAYDRQICKPAD